MPEQTDSWITRVGLKRAMDIVCDHINDWPEDKWVSIGKDFDVNLWTETPGTRRIASLYPVVDGSPDTSRFVRIFESFTF